MSARGGRGGDAGGRLASIRSSILRWYLRHRRDLPWRRTRDPYAIWVSEIMLQQTRVETVIPYYERFLEKYPNVGALARARSDDVLAAWSGLGYYRRARNMIEASRVVVREHAATFPRDIAALRSLPGIGSYTAAALASIAFAQPAAAVDGNVVRVLARIEGLRGSRTSGALKRAVADRAERLAHGTRPGDWTQALMELGATVCLPLGPLCGRCPAARECRACAGGSPERFPDAARIKKALPGRRLVLVARSGSRLLVIPDPGDGLSTWTFPYASIERGASVRTANALVRRHLEGLAKAEGPKASFRHRTFSHDWAYEVWTAQALAKRNVGPHLRTQAGQGAGPKGALWVRRRDLPRLPLRAHTLKALAKLEKS